MKGEGLVERKEEKAMDVDVQGSGFQRKSKIQEITETDKQASSDP